MDKSCFDPVVVYERRGWRAGDVCLVGLVECCLCGGCDGGEFTRPQVVIIYIEEGEVGVYMMRSLGREGLVR